MVMGGRILGGERQGPWYRWAVAQEQQRGGQ